MVIKNAQILGASLHFVDPYGLNIKVSLDCNGEILDIGSYCVGHGSLHTEDIENIVGTKCASETMSRIMWAVGVTSWESLKGKYCRVKLQTNGKAKLQALVISLVINGSISKNIWNEHVIK